MKRTSLWIGVCVLIAAVMTACNVDQAASGAAAQGQNPAAAGQQPQGAPVQDQNTAAQGQNQAAPQGQNSAVTQSAEEAQAVQQLGQLTIGILYIQDSGSNTLTADQATRLLTYYQDIQTSQQAARDAAQNATPPADFTPQAGGPGGNGGGPGGNGGPNGAPPAGGSGGMGGVGFMMLRGIDAARLQADVTGIQSTLTADQVAVITALTPDQVQATLQKHNMGGMGGGPGGNGGPNPQATPDPNQMATMQALGPQGGANGGPGGRGSGGTALLDEVIKVLQTAVGS